MRKSKFVHVCLGVALALCFTGCDGSSMSQNSGYATIDESVQSESTVVQTADTVENTSNEASVIIEDPSVGSAAESSEQQDIIPAEFDKVTLQWKDNDGYIFEGTFAVSDWIKYDDEELLNATWKSVADGKAFPDFSSHIYIGSTWFNGSYLNASYDCADIVYAIGYYQINNTTSGFDITSEKPVSAFFNFYVSTPLSMMAVAWNDKAVLYKSTQKFIHECTDSETGIFTESKGNSIKLTTGLFLADNGTSPSPKMTTNATKVVPFVIAISIAKNPNHPEGIPKMDEVIISPVIYDAESGQVINYDFKPAFVQ